MGLQQKVRETLDRTDDFIADVRALGDDPDPADISMLTLRGRFEVSTIDGLIPEAEAILDTLTEPVEKNLCLQLIGVLKTERSGIEKVLDALIKADKAEKISAETEILKEIKKIRERSWETTNES